MTRSLLLVTSLTLVASFTSGARAELYEVGDGKPLATLGEVPWESLRAGDEVRIHHRASPYREKVVLAVSGSANAPIRIVGVPSSSGQRPVLDGDRATTRAALDYWGQERGVIKIGGASKPSAALGAYIEIEGLEIRGAREGRSFGDPGGTTKNYADNAAAVFIERGEHVLLRNCALLDSGNGLFVANQSVDIRVERSEINGNGNVGSDQEHNVYSEALGIVFEGNQLGALCAGCLGNNLKDRSAGTVIRYNWIEGGNRQLDLVDSSSATLRGDPRYAETHVYGNVLIENDDAGNRQIVHWGGDSSTSANYRKGVLLLYANTIVSKRQARTTLLRNSSPSGRADVFGNIVQCGNGVGQLEILGDALGRATLRNNWLTAGWVPSFANNAQVDADASNQMGGDPGFVDAVKSDYALAVGSVCINAGGFPQLDAAFDVKAQAPKPRALTTRPDDGKPDVGALEVGASEPLDGGVGTDDGGGSGESDAGGGSDDAGGGAGGGTNGGTRPEVPPVYDGGADDLPGPGASNDDGCSCSAAQPASGGGWSLLMALGLLLRRRATRASARGTLGSTRPSRHRAA